MTQQMRQKREELKSLSAGFRMMVKSGAISSINAGLANYYASLGHTTLKSYRRWKEEGFQVKQGSKALLLWAEPRPLKPLEKQPPEGEDEETFFPMAYVFSNLQVSPITTGAQPV